MRKDVTAKMENVTQHNPVTHPLFLKGCGCDDVTEGKPRKLARKLRRAISKGLRFDVLNRDGFKCRYCGASQKDGATLHIDHVVAVARGGKNEIGNLVTACAACNLGKSAKPLVAIPQDPPQAIPLEGQKLPQTYGLSFRDNGVCNWQFVIDGMSEHAAKITTFSWMDGTDYSTEHVSRKFLEESCLLFADHASFIRAADYWGGWDVTGERRNPKFCREGAK